MSRLPETALRPTMRVTSRFSRASKDRPWISALVRRTPDMRVMSIVLFTFSNVVADGSELGIQAPRPRKMRVDPEPPKSPSRKTYWLLAQFVGVATEPPEVADTEK